MNDRNNMKALIWGLLYLLVAFVFIFPMIKLLLMSFTTEAGFGINHYSLLLKEQRTTEAIKNTIIIASGASMISVLVGGVLAFLVAYTNIKRKKTIEVLILSQFVIPSYVLTLSWSHLFHKSFINMYSLTGIVFILGLCNIPMVYLITVHMLRKVHRDWEWAARISGYNQTQTMLRINLVQVLPALIGGGILAFLSAMDNFSVPAFLGISSGIPVLSTYIYEKAISFGPRAFYQAAALSVMLSCIAIVGTLLQGSFIKKSSNMDSIREDYSVRIELGETNRKITEWILLLILGFINIVPFMSMLIISFQKYFGAKLLLSNMTMRNYTFVFTNRGIMVSLFNSLFLALFTGGACMLIGTIIAYVKARKNSKAIKMVEMAASMTYAVPGIVLALAMIFHWSKVPNVYGTIKILMIAYVTRYLILQIKGSTSAVLSLEPSLEEASAISGMNFIKTLKKIIIPLIGKQILVSFFFIFVASFTELTLSSMLAAAGTKTIGLSVFNLQQAGNYNLSAALSVMIVVFIFSGYLVMLLIEKMNALQAERREFIKVGENKNTIIFKKGEIYEPKNQSCN